MATTKKKAPAKKRKKTAKTVSPEELHVLALIRATERVITGHQVGLDEYFIRQLARLKSELSVLGKKK